MRKSYLFVFNSDRDSDIIDELNSRFNRTEFIRFLVREYLKKCEECQNGFWD